MTPYLPSLAFFILAAAAVFLGLCALPKAPEKKPQADDPGYAGTVQHYTPATGKAELVDYAITPEDPPSEPPQPGFGPDGYGHAHLRKEDSLLVERVIESMRHNINREFPVFAIDMLAYPQYERYYQLTKEQWAALQDYCRLQLIDPVATESVIAHWRSIVAGTPPFGLTIREDTK